MCSILLVSIPSPLFPVVKERKKGVMIQEEVSLNSFLFAMNFYTLLVYRG